ncbi:MAG TPA: RHS repeat-associated core domain-containing protein [Acidobacteriaceae bacterium]|nr:RHS repeat-associated core domain-containing protein [Acidobacteriaceae bacterium]
MSSRRICLVFVLGLTVLTAQAGKVTYIYPDPQGTPLAEADSSGAVTATFDYRPYGSQSLGAAPSGPGYTGHTNDADTGLIYMQARYYDPSLGRFISVDPHPVSTGALFFINRFVYANNAPSRYTDERGDKPGDKFRTPELAAYDALQYINPTSIATNHEYSGWITIVDRQFVATTPIQMKEDGGVTPAPGVPVVGDYHTHGHYSIKNKDGTFTLTNDPSKDNLGSDHFSKEDTDRSDTLSSDNNGVFRAYLGTPGNKYLMYLPSTKQVFNLQDVVQVQQQQDQQPPPPPPPPSTSPPTDDSQPKAQQ